MFSLFKRLSRSEVTTIEQSSVHLATIIISQAEAFIQQNKELTALSTTSNDAEYHTLRSNLELLRDSNLGNSKNAQAIRDRIAELDRQTSMINDAAKLLKFVKSLRMHLGDHVLLIGKQQFFDLCKKYKLLVGSLSQYTGTVPDKNLKEIVQSKKLMDSLADKWYINSKEDILLVGQVEYNAGYREGIEAAKKVSEYISNHGAIVYSSCIRDRYSGPLGHCTTLEDVLFDDRNLGGIPTYSNPGVIKILGRRPSYSDFFIACPPEQLRAQEIKFIAKPIDPIVFQFSPYGIIVHSMWGDEAEDKVFEEYKRINDLMLG